jgi:ribosomal protein L37E
LSTEASRVTNYCDTCGKNTLHVDAQILGDRQEVAVPDIWNWLYCRHCGSANVRLHDASSWGFTQQNGLRSSRK